ncbi:MAG TPA: NADH-quinone oxidoreductase subunit A [Dehalococcoidia bacterium]|nr:NADH-quinone oxidoreductase subunit A [Dehalococcoidia bacterium]HLB28554.1 NADH-quinone oxidoreductase subunit A [Dehalococcoidia bacterium]
MLSGWGQVGLLLVLALLFPLGGIVTSRLLQALRLRPSRPDPVKDDTYECGVTTEGPTWVQFNIRYYLIALVFLVFDIEVLFLFPWAVAFGTLGIGGFVAATIFILVLGLGLVYDWLRGGLEWT